MNLDDIKPNQIDGKPQKVGQMGEKDLFQVRTKGGLYMLITKSGKGFSIVSVGPHRQVARHIASNNNDDVVFTDLSKSDHIPIEHYELILPEYQELLAKLRKANGE